MKIFVSLISLHRLNDQLDSYLSFKETKLSSFKLNIECIYKNWIKVENQFECHAILYDTTSSNGKKVYTILK